MGLRTFVKVGEVSNLSDARYCAGMGVDIIGFVIDPNDSAYVAPETFSEIVGWVAGVAYCGEFSAETLEDYTDQISKYELQYVQSDSIEALNSLSGFEKILKVNVTDQSSLDTLTSILNSDHDLSYIVIEAEDSMEDSLNSLIQNSNPKHKIVRGYALDTDSVETLSEKFHGIALKGSEEIRPGYKDYDELADILEALDED